MGHFEHRPDRPKPWRAGYRGPDGRNHSKSFKRRVDTDLIEGRLVCQSIHPDDGLTTDLLRLLPLGGSSGMEWCRLACSPPASHYPPTKSQGRTNRHGVEGDGGDLPPRLRARRPTNEVGVDPSKHGLFHGGKVGGEGPRAGILESKVEGKGGRVMAYIRDRGKQHDRRWQAVGR
jgi:hypothetical protein